MSATMARQGGCVQMELSNMRLALNMAKTGQGQVFACRNSGNAVSDQETLR